MKDLHVILSEIQSIREQNFGLNLERNEKQRIANKIKFLNQCKLYLETNPSKEFIEKSIKSIQDRIAKINEGFNSWRECTPDVNKYSNPISTYNSQMGLGELNTQLKTLEYLLK